MICLDKRFYVNSAVLVIYILDIHSVEGRSYGLGVLEIKRKSSNDDKSLWDKGISNDATLKTALIIY